MNDEQHLRKSTRVLKPTRKLLEQLETEEWIKSQEAQRYVLDDGESVISQIKSVSTDADGSENPTKSKCSRTSYNAKIGLSNVHTNQFSMREMPLEPQLDTEHCSEYSRGAYLPCDLRHVELLPDNQKTTLVSQHYISRSRVSNKEPSELASSHEALSEHAPHLPLVKPSKMHHTGIPIEFTEYHETNSKRPIPTNAPKMSNVSKSHELPSGSYSIPKVPQKLDPSIQEAADNREGRTSSDFFKHPACSGVANGSVHSAHHSRTSRVSKRSKTSSLQRQATQIEEALYLHQLTEENDNLIVMQLREQERIAQRKTEEKILLLKREDEERHARLHHELELQNKHNMIKRRDLEMSLFQAKAELSEAMEESADLEPLEMEPTDRNDTIHAVQSEHDHWPPRHFQRTYPSIPPPMHSQAPLRNENHPNQDYALQTAQIAKMFADSINISRLPVPQPEVFTGDPLKFNSWISSFSILIESKGVPLHEKIHYLKQYLGGEAKQTVDTLTCLDDAHIYAKAKALLQKRYGSSFIISEAYREKIASWPRIQVKDGISLRNFGDFLQQCLIAKDSVKGLQILDDCHENRKMLEKLPVYLVERWSRQICDYNEYPDFRTFVAFIVKEADILCNPITNLRLTKSDQMKKDTAGRSYFVSESADANDAPQLQCVYCRKNYHNIYNCRSFTSRSSNERSEFITKNGLCFGCLKKGHMSRKCPKRSICQKCNKQHPSCLHDDYVARVAKEQANAAEDSSAESMKEEDIGTIRTKVSHRLIGSADVPVQTSMIVPVYLSVAGAKDEILVYCILDTQSDTSFITEKTASKLGATYTNANLKLSTMTSTEVLQCKKFRNLNVRGIHESTMVNLPVLYSRDTIPVKRSHIPTTETANKWNHLNTLCDVIPEMQECDVGLLIGYNCPQALAPREVITGNINEPYAQKTDLGWSIVGMNSTDSKVEDSVSHKIVTIHVPDDLRLNGNKGTNSTHFVYRTSCKELLDIMENDFSNCSHVPPLQTDTISQDDLKFVKIIESSIHRQENGFYESPLPFRDAPNLPNNRCVAKKRLDHLKRRLLKDSRYLCDYQKFMDDIIAEGYAVESQDTDEFNNWYLPHHGVYHHKKPDKIRVVFDCSARYKNTSLNDQLLQGPDILNPLLGVLCRFREHPIALMCDVEKMFYRFKVNPECRKFLKFLWWKNGNLSDEPTTYEMTVHIFGAVSSPGCANFALKKIAEDNKDICTEMTYNFLNRNFYVDDGLISVASTKQATRIVQESMVVCSNGKLRLHKFVSNSRKVLECVPQSERATSILNYDLELGHLPTERALGVSWCTETDQLQFKMNGPKMMEARSRRQILSVIASLYDPLGLLAPFILVGKVVLQQMCHLNCGWDDPVTGELKDRWNKWLSDLSNLKLIQVPRNLYPNDFDDVIRYEIHNFSDASTSGYGCCSYLRVIYGSGRIYCSLIVGKSRVAPSKVTTIPRLELTAALLSVKMCSMLRKELTYKVSDEVFWTDSKIVLSYLNNDCKRFHTFVANRIQQIKDKTIPAQWRYVRTEENPADTASRGATIPSLVKSDWYKGPKFLWETSVSDSDEIDTTISTDDPNVRAIALQMQVNVENHLDLSRLDRFFSWQSMRRAVALCLKYIQKLRSQIPKERRLQKGFPPCTVYTVDDLNNAALVIIRNLQRDAYSETISRLQEEQVLPKNNKLAMLDVTIDELGILRVGGRLQNSTMSFDIKHPIILPRRSHVTDLIIRYHHEKVQHQGRGFTINEIRSHGYWIIGCSKAVSSHIHKCITCRKLRGNSSCQKMAPLPEVRLQEVPPFTHVGIDCFGPFTVKERRSHVKRYGLLITCMASRAIHIEVLDDMTTDSFINGIRCFIAIRGNVLSIRCDNGTNFHGASRELRKAVDELDDSTIRQFLLTNQCQYIFNSPDSSHMGGSWERHIRTIRSILSSMIYNHPTKVDTTSLRTFLYEVMAIVNGRPLTAQNLNSPTSPESLTPNHILTMKSTVIVPPPGSFTKDDVYLRKRWRHVQYLANEFWNRWRKEYILLLQSRQKWKAKEQEIGVGDIVLVKDVNTVRGQWSMARVIETLPSSDGLVRRVKLIVGDMDLNKDGSRRRKQLVMERPIHKLVLLVEGSM